MVDGMESCQFFHIAGTKSSEETYLTYRRRHKKTSYISNYAFSTLLHKWVDRGQTHNFEKLQ